MKAPGIAKLTAIELGVVERCATKRLSSRHLDARLLRPDPEGSGTSASITARLHEVAPWSEMAVNDPVRRQEVLRLTGRLNLCICRSRLRVGRCEFSARLFNTGWSGDGPRAGQRVGQRRSCADHQ